jgi:hypothetical protein
MTKIPLRFPSLNPAVQVRKTFGFPHSRASPYGKSQIKIFLHAGMTKIPLRFPSLNPAVQVRKTFGFPHSRASPYGKSQIKIFLHAGMTKIFIRLFPHCSLPS